MAARGLASARIRKTTRLASANDCKRRSEVFRVGACMHPGTTSRLHKAVWGTQIDTSLARRIHMFIIKRDTRRLLNKCTLGHLSSSKTRPELEGCKAMPLAREARAEHALHRILNPFNSRASHAMRDLHSSPAGRQPVCSNPSSTFVSLDVAFSSRVPVCIASKAVVSRREAVPLRHSSFECTVDCAYVCSAKPQNTSRCLYDLYL